eukprot:COSAG01_NODE_17959_length_1111_cov_2.000988_1_plen_92_part_00
MRRRCCLDHGCAGTTGTGLLAGMAEHPMWPSAAAAAACWILLLLLLRMHTAGAQPGRHLAQEQEAAAGTQGLPAADLLAAWHSEAQSVQCC